MYNGIIAHLTYIINYFNVYFMLKEFIIGIRTNRELRLKLGKNKLDILCFIIDFRLIIVKNFY